VIKSFKHKAVERFFTTYELWQTRKTKKKLKVKRLDAA
jgi:hypothetical protein